MRLGGSARYVIEVGTADEVAEAYDFARERKLPVYVLGGGANTIGRDEGYAGVILRCQIRGLRFTDAAGQKLSDEQVEALSAGTESAIQAATPIYLEAGAGEVWDDVCALAAAHGLTGIGRRCAGAEYWRLWSGSGGGASKRQSLRHADRTKRGAAAGGVEF